MVHFMQLAGSGTIEITSSKTGSSSVPVDTNHDFIIEYTAATTFKAAYIRVMHPGVIEGATAERGCRFNGC